ncbi:MAG: zinc-binding dehydrogenase [Deltaproteobacteria bacterium]|nr:zinc-binding dehydrogenase [Deltaproteobacteria bacterium]
MRAAILEEGKLVVKDVPKPSPGHEEALVKLTTSGICHSDVHLAKGHWYAGLSMPMGHEGIGIVEELGPGAEAFVQKGDRVILGLGGAGGGYWCGACEYCLSGKPRLCKQTRPLFGTYSEYISLWVKTLVKLPEEVSDREVPLACGGLTSYSAVKKLIKFGVSPGKPVAIVGAAGGLGHYAVQIAKLFGYKVVGIDVGPEKIEFVKSLGADYALDVSEALDFVKQKLEGVYASIVFAPKIAGFELGLQLLRRAGVFVAVGLPPANEGPMSVTPMELMQRDPLIMGSAVGTVEEMRELVQLAADGKVKTHISKAVSLSEANQVLDELEEGKYLGRAIIDDMTK